MKLSTHPYLVFALTSLLIIFGCDHKEILGVRIDNSNATRAVIEFEIDKTSEAIITYWLAKDPKNQSTTKSPNSTDHRIILNQLLPESEYLFRIQVNNEQSDIFQFQTGSLPYLLPKMTLEIGNISFDGQIMIRKVNIPSMQLMINDKAEITWYQMYDTVLFRPFSWTDENTVLALRNEGLITETDLGGREILNLKKGQGGFDSNLHHEIIKDDEGNYHSLTRNQRIFDFSTIGIHETDTIFGDGIIVLDPDGRKIWEWDIYDHEDPFAYENIYDMRDDWSHGNSLAFDHDEHYLVSFRNFHQVWKIHSETGEIMWKLGKDGDFNLPDTALFYSQHSAHCNRFGEVMLFDNGGPERQTSRALSFKITGKGEWEPGRIHVALPAELFSFKEGSVYLMDEERLLFCSTRTNSIVITDKQGHVLWKLRTPDDYYRALYIDHNQL